MSAERAVAWLADIAAPHDKFTEKEVDAVMADVGVSAALPARVYIFTQEALSRFFLESLYEHIPFRICGIEVSSVEAALAVPRSRPLAPDQTLQLAWSSIQSLKRLVPTQMGV